MRRELVIERATGALWGALIEDGHVAELALERETALQPEAILRVRVREIAPQNEAAFLDLGDGRSGFLAARDAGAGGAGKKGGAIAKRLQAGQYCTVQVKSVPPAPEKAWPVTARIAQTGRYIVFHPDGRGLEMPRGGLDAAQRNRLEEALAPITAKARLRLRRPAGTVEATTVRAEAERLAGQAQALESPANALATLLSAPPPLTRLLREAPPAPSGIHLGEPALLAEAKTLAANWPDLVDSLALWREPTPAFEVLGAEAALEAVMAGRLDLPSGGRVTLEATQAASVIDVDAGATGAGRTAAAARRSANQEAAVASARLLRLANVGGLVVIDFLNMKSRKDRERTLAALDEALADDPAAVHRSGMNGHGLVSLTRARRGTPLRERLVTTPSPQPSLEARGLTLLRRAEREAASDRRPGSLILETAPELAAWLEAEGCLEALQTRTGRHVRLDTQANRGDMAEAARIEPL